MTPRRLSKKTRLLIIAILLALTVAARVQEEVVDKGISLGQQRQPGLYEVVEVFDGDTVAVNMGGAKETVRMIGVDTPETHHPEKAVQCFGRAATSYTERKALNQLVRLEADPLNTNRDRYSRLLRYVYLSDGTMLNEQIIMDGYGFSYTSFPFTRADEFDRYEKEAREAGRGLWKNCDVTSDEDYEQTNPER